MRLFVALRLPADVAAHAESALAPVRVEHPGPRWVPPERWHLTLAFHGEVPDDKVAGLADKLARRVLRHGPLELRLRGSGHFSRRALWLGVDGDLDRMRSLARDVTADGSPFRAHLTVARLRGGVDPAPARTALAGLLRAVVGRRHGPPGALPARSLTDVRRRRGLAPGGPVVGPAGRPVVGSLVVDPRTRRRLVLAALALFVLVVLVGALA